MRRPTARVMPLQGHLRWEGRFARETESRQSQEDAKKNAGRTPSRVHTLLARF